MARITTFNYYVKSEVDKTKPSILYVMYTLDKIYKVSLGISIYLDMWDKDKRRAVQP